VLYRVSKIESACDQLDWAIRLLIDSGAYFPAITLAGASEEMLGRAAGDRSTFKQLLASLPKSYGIPEKLVSQVHLNGAKLAEALGSGRARIR
jgi:hypothetical protein